MELVSTDDPDLYRCGWCGELLEKLSDELLLNEHISEEYIQQIALEVSEPPRKPA